MAEEANGDTSRGDICPSDTRETAKNKEKDGKSKSRGAFQKRSRSSHLKRNKGRGRARTRKEKAAAAPVTLNISEVMKAGWAKGFPPASKLPPGGDQQGLLETLSGTDDVELLRKIALKLYNVAVSSEARSAALQQQLEHLLQLQNSAAPVLTAKSLPTRPVPLPPNAPLEADRKDSESGEVLDLARELDRAAAAPRSPRLVLPFCHDLAQALEMIEETVDKGEEKDVEKAVTPSKVPKRKTTSSGNRHALRIPRAVLQFGPSGAGASPLSALDLKERRESTIHMALGKKRNVFGASLAEFEYAGRETRLPLVMETLLAAIELRGGFETEGIFRRAAGAAEMKRFEAQINRGDYALVADIGGAHVPASLLLRWLASLQEPLVPWDLYADFLDAKTRAAREACVLRLPNINRDVLLGLCKFLGRMLARTVVEKTKMDASNLSMTICPSIFRPPVGLAPLEMVKNNTRERGIVEAVVLDCATDDTFGASTRGQNLIGDRLGLFKSAPL